MGIVSRSHSIIAALAALGCASASYATVLTFDFSSYANGLSLSQSYGDRVTGSTMTYNADPRVYFYGSTGGYTPNVTVGYRSYNNSSDVALTSYEFNYGNLERIAYLNQEASQGYSLVFAADAGHTVTLGSFDFATWGNVPTPVEFTIYDENNVALWTSGQVTPDIGATLHHTLSPYITGDYLRLAVNLSQIGSNAADNLGIDNIVFGQDGNLAVPEPATLGVVGSSLLLLLRRRRK